MKGLTTKYINKHKMCIKKITLLNNRWQLVSKCYNQKAPNVMNKINLNDKYIIEIC